ncbi:MAG: hypothetical protein WDZ41_05155 [Candidatus Babeliales bacterium]
MKHNNDLLHKQCVLLTNLNHLPKKVILLHSREEYQHHVPEFILHELCHESCFDLSKAAYFVDNPDFRCLKGVAGVCKHESGYCEGLKDIWEEPEKFTEYMEKSEFNKKVRTIERLSMAQDSEESVLNIIAGELDFANPCYFKWPLKHGNSGLLVIEKNEETSSFIDEHLPHGVYLLSFCPVH